MVSRDYVRNLYRDVRLLKVKMEKGSDYTPPVMQFGDLEYGLAVMDAKGTSFTERQILSNMGHQMAMLLRNSLQYYRLHYDDTKVSCSLS